MSDDWTYGREKSFILAGLRSAATVLLHVAVAVGYYQVGRAFSAWLGLPV